MSRINPASLRIAEKARENIAPCTTRFDGMVNAGAGAFSSLNRGLELFKQARYQDALAVFQQTARENRITPHCATSWALP